MGSTTLGTLQGHGTLLPQRAATPPLPSTTPMVISARIPGISQNLPKHALPTVLLRHLRQTFLRGLEVCPFEVCIGVGVLPNHSHFPKYLLPLFHPLMSSSYPSIHSELNSPQINNYFASLKSTSVSPSPRRPFPLSHLESLSPLGFPCPWELPCHLSQLSYFCSPPKIGTHGR